MNYIDKEYKILMTFGELKTVKGKVFSLMTLPKHLFGVRKENGKWVGDHLNSGRSLGIEEDSQQKATDKIVALLSDKKILDRIKGTASIKLAKDTFLKADDLLKEFEELTELKLNKSAIGVDLAQLENLVSVDDTETLRDKIKIEFGERADEIITELINGDVMIDSTPQNNAKRYFEQKTTV